MVAKTAKGAQNSQFGRSSPKIKKFSVDDGELQLSVRKIIDKRYKYRLMLRKRALRHLMHASESINLLTARLINKAFKVVGSWFMRERTDRL